MTFSARHGAASGSIRMAAALTHPMPFEEDAQVMAAESRLDGQVPPLFGAASGGPCASFHAWSKALHLDAGNLRIRTLQLPRTPYLGSVSWASQRDADYTRVD